MRVTRIPGKTKGIYFIGNLQDGLSTKIKIKPITKGVTNNSLGAFKELEIEEKRNDFFGFKHKHKLNYDKIKFFFIFIFETLSEKYLT